MDVNLAFLQIKLTPMGPGLPSPKMILFSILIRDLLLKDQITCTKQLQSKPL